MKRVELKRQRQQRRRDDDTRPHYIPNSGRLKDNVEYVAWSTSWVRQYARENGFDWTDMRIWKNELGAISHPNFWLVPINHERRKDMLSKKMQSVLGVDTLSEFMELDFADVDS